VLILGLFLLVALINQQVLQILVEDLQQSLEEATQANELGLELQNEYLTARQAETDFLDRWRRVGYATAAVQYLPENARRLESARARLSDLQAIVERNPNNGIFIHLGEEITEIETKLDTYERAFTTVADLTRQRAQSGGLEQQLLTTSSNLASQVSGLENPQYASLVLQMRNNELAYGNTTQQQYYDNVRRLVSQFNNLVEASTLADLTTTDGVVLNPDELQDQADAYLVLVDELVDVEGNLGINTAIFEQISNDINEITAHINLDSEQIVQQTQAEFAATADRLSFVTTVISLVAIGLGLLITYLLSRRIIAPLQLLTSAAQGIAMGNFDQQINLKRHDEFAVMAAAFNSMVQQLRLLVTGLEERVLARTRDLTLAGEVGQVLSQVTDLEELLSESVELIRERFDLYYVQIYLVDAQGGNLVLRAGTGNVGVELKWRGHMLPLNSGSINGSAVVNRQTMLVPDTEKSPVFRRNPLLPKTRSEMAVPLIVGGRIVGVLDMQSSQANALSTDNVLAFETLAGQLAIAIDNARLFRDIRRSQESLAAQTRQLVRSNWDTYLDGVHHSELMGYQYVEGEVQALGDEVAQVHTAVAMHTTKVQVAGELLGAIEVIRPDNQLWSDEQEDLVAFVANRVSQQLENLRLLSEAERYRQEAMEAASRIVRQGWEGYLSDQRVHGFTYDQVQVTPVYRDEPVVVHENDEVTAVIAQPLLVQDNQIGEILVAGVDEATAVPDTFLASIAERLSNHIETLRLSQQTQNALRETERRTEELTVVNRVVALANASLDIGENLQIISQELVQALQLDEVGIAILENETDDFLTVVAQYHRLQGPSFIGFHIPLADNETTLEVLRTQQPVMVTNAQENPATQPVHEQMRHANIQQLAILPLVVGQKAIGTVGLAINSDRMLTQDEINLAQTILLQAGAAVQNARLFNQTQKTLALTENLYTAGEAISASGDDYQVALAAMMTAIAETAVHRAMILLFQRDAADTLQSARVIATWHTTNAEVALPVGARLDAASFPQIAQLMIPSLRIYNQLQAKSASPDQLIALLQQFHSPAAALAPMQAGGQQIGVIIIEATDPNSLTDTRLAPYVALTGQIALAIDRQTLLVQAQQRARREQTLRELSSRVNAAIDAEAILRTTAQEIHRRFGLETFIRLDEQIQPDVTAVNGGNGHN
jgi:GAF domain-containing protein/HAMP domain-containing protein